MQELCFTFLNSNKSVRLLKSHIRGISFGRSNGAKGCQYSMNPFSSADMTVSYLSLYYPTFESIVLLGNMMMINNITGTHCHNVHGSAVDCIYSHERLVIPSSIVDANHPATMI